MPNPRNLSGQRFGRLIAIKWVSTQTNGQRRWLCRCDCGTDHIVGVGNLRSSAVRSCGCLRVDQGRAAGAASLRHGHCSDSERGGSAEYKALRSAIKRCHDPSARQFCDYGGRGIKVCDEWRVPSARARSGWAPNFEAFFADIGPRPGPGYSLERKRVDGNYESGNVVWATPLAQSRNRRNSLHNRMHQWAEVQLAFGA